MIWNNRNISGELFLTYKYLIYLLNSIPEETLDNYILLFMSSPQGISLTKNTKSSPNREFYYAIKKSPITKVDNLN